MTQTCELCGRENVLTFHHLIPRCLHSNKWFKKNFSRQRLNEGIMICKYECHREIHNMIPNKELGKNYNTIKKILSHRRFSGYIKWISKR